MYFPYFFSSLFCFLFSSWHMTNCSSCLVFHKYLCYWYRQVTLDGFILSKLLPLVCLGSRTALLFLMEKQWVSFKKKKVCFVSGGKILCSLTFFFPQKVRFIACFRYCYKCILIVIPIFLQTLTHSFGYC